MSGKRRIPDSTPDSIRARLLESSSVDQETGCWNFLRGLISTGYGQLWIPETRSRMLSHRASYEYLVGHIPEGMHVCHKCDNHKCCNPDHLFVGTAADNMRDMREKGRGYNIPARRGEDHLKAKLDWARVRSIREERSSVGTKVSELATRYHVSISLIGQILRGTIWRAA